MLSFSFRSAKLHRAGNKLKTSKKRSDYSRLERFYFASRMSDTLKNKGFQRFGIWIYQIGISICLKGIFTYQKGIKSERRGKTSPVNKTIALINNISGTHYYIGR